MNITKSWCAISNLRITWNWEYWRRTSINCKFWRSSWSKTTLLIRRRHHQRLRYIFHKYRCKKSRLLRKLHRSTSNHNQVSSRQFMRQYQDRSSMMRPRNSVKIWIRHHNKYTLTWFREVDWFRKPIPYLCQKDLEKFHRVKKWMWKTKISTAMIPLLTVKICLPRPFNWNYRIWNLRTKYT